MSIVDATAHRAGPAATSRTRRRESDLTLIKLVRQGDVKAYARLYERHVAAAGNLARQLTRSPAEADDLVSEAFAKVLDMLRAGRRPVQAFRAYLLTALRHTAYDKTRANRKIQLADDISTVTGIRAESVSTAFTDTAVAALEHSLAAQAFTQLPDRWQEVLWHTEVESRTPSDVAAIIGLRPNGVSAPGIPGAERPVRRLPPSTTPGVRRRPALPTDLRPARRLGMRQPVQHEEEDPDR